MEQWASESLLGTRVVVAVSEPWGFARTNGTRELTGTVIDAGTDGTRDREWVAVTVASFESKEGARVTRVVATERHRTRGGLFAALSGGGEAIVNLRYSPGDASDPTDFAAGPLPFLVGEVRPAGDG